MRLASSLAATLFAVGAAGPACGVFDTPSTSTGDGGTYGFGAPTLEVTVGGVHAGPAAPDPGSAASLVNVRDGSGRIVQSSFTLSASLNALGASCSLGGSRQNPDGTTGIGTQSYLFIADTTGVSQDSAVSPTGTEAMVLPQATMICAGSGCNGATLAITALDSAHAEGYVSGTFADAAGRGTADVACSFYLPMGRYAP